MQLAAVKVRDIGSFVELVVAVSSSLPEAYTKYL